MKFAPGTPRSVIKAAEQAWMSGNRPKVDKTAPVRPKVDKKLPPPTVVKKPVFRDVMPVIGGAPKISDKEKASYEKELAEKIKANTPQPTRPVLPRPTTPPPPVKPTPRVIGPSPMPKPAMPTQPTQPIPLVGRPTTAQPAMPTKPSMAMRKGGSVSKASSRADGIAKKGKTKGRYI
jgi:hypothetical protein